MTSHRSSAGTGATRLTRLTRLTGAARSTRVRLAGASALLAAVGILASAGPAAASTVNGVATVANPTTDAPLASGGSATEFTLTLPAQAACSGDTQSDGYNVWSYVIPAPTSGTVEAKVLAINFLSLSGYYPLFEANGDYYGPANTAATTGEIIGLPVDFQFLALNNALGGGTGSGSLLNGKSSATYDAGIACTNQSHAVSDFWNFQVTFKKSSSDPNGFTWTDLPGVPPPAPKVKAVSPTSGSHLGGTPVTVTGSNFLGTTKVVFGTKAGTITSVAATKIVVTSPAGAVGSVNVRVLTPSGESKVVTADQFTYT